MFENFRHAGLKNFRRSMTAAFAAALLLLLPLLSSCAFRDELGDADLYRSLTIYHINDAHSHLEPMKDPDDKIYYGGASRLKTLIDSADRSRSIFLVAGDFVQGTLYYNFFHGAAEAEVFSAIGVDAACLGNHEFDGGSAQLESYFAKASFPLLCSNIVFKTAPALSARVKPYAMIERNGLTIAVIGADTLDIVQSTPKLGDEIEQSDPLAAVKKLAAELRGNADLVIALTHIGYELDLKLAAEAEGLDVIIGGHSHTPVMSPVPVAGRGGTCYVAQAGAYLKYLGRLDLGVAPRGAVRAGMARVSYGGGGLTPVAQSVAPDAAIDAIVKKYGDQIGQAVKQVIAKTAVELVGTTTAARGGECNLGNLYADALLDYSKADLAVVNGGTFRQSITGPDITIESVLGASPYDSFIATIKVSGEDIIEDLKMTAARADGEWGGFLQVSRGVRIVIANRSLVSVSLNGEPIDPARTYTLATSDYIAGGGDGHARFAGKNPDLGAMVKTNDVVIEYMKNLPQPINYTTQGRISISSAIPSAAFMRACR